MREKDTACALKEGECTGVPAASSAATDAGDVMGPGDWEVNNEAELLTPAVATSEDLPKMRELESALTESA